MREGKSGAVAVPQSTRCEPARIAMREDIDRLARLLSARDRFNQAKAVPADRLMIAISSSAISPALPHRAAAARADGESGQALFRISSSAHFRLIAVGRSVAIRTL